MNHKVRPAFSLSAFVKSCLLTLGFIGAAGLMSPLSQPAIAFSVCGINREEASFKTKSYLVTICRGEASFQMVMTYWDGTGYRKIPVQKEGRKFRGSDGKNNFIIDSKQLIIGTDGEQPVRENVIQSK